MVRSLIDTLIAKTIAKTRSRRTPVELIPELSHRCGPVSAVQSALADNACVGERTNFLTGLRPYAVNVQNVDVAARLG